MCACQGRGGLVVGSGESRWRGLVVDVGRLVVGSGESRWRVVDVVAALAGERDTAATSGTTYHVEGAGRPLRSHVRLDPEVEELERGHPEAGVHRAVVARLRRHDHQRQAFAAPRELLHVVRKALGDDGAGPLRPLPHTIAFRIGVDLLLPPTLLPPSSPAALHSLPFATFTHFSILFLITRNGLN